MNQPAISHISFLTPGNYLDDAPLPGLEQTLQLFELGERLGFHGAWVRQRHLEHGVSSASTFLAAATQRTRQIELGSAVIQMGYESPFRLAEDLATVDILSRGRLNVGLSAGQPNHLDLIGAAVWGEGWQQQDFSYQRVLSLRENLSGRFFGDDNTVIQSPGNQQRPRVQPFAPGLVNRLWYGGGSLRSARWAGLQGFNLLSGNLTSGEETDDFYQAQRAQIQLYRESVALAGQRQTRIALGRVIIPTDSADAATRQRYQQFVARRYERTLTPQGPRRTLFSLDRVGSAEQILEQLLNDPVLPLVNELRIELPYEFSFEEYSQIISDFATRIAPELGWKPASETAPTSRYATDLAGEPK